MSHKYTYTKKMSKITFKIINLSHAKKIEIVNFAQAEKCCMHFQWFSSMTPSEVQRHHAAAVVSIVDLHLFVTTQVYILTNAISYCMKLIK